MNPSNCKCVSAAKKFRFLPEYEFAVPKYYYIKFKFKQGKRKNQEKMMSWSVFLIKGGSAQLKLIAAIFFH
jgi:hypothetical protein